TAGLLLGGDRGAARQDDTCRDAGGRAARRPLRHGRAPDHRDAEPPDPERARRADRRPRARARGRRAAGRGVAVLARHDRVHRDRILQARANRDQRLRAPARRGARTSAPRLRPARQDPHHGLPQQLRPALDRGHRGRGQEAQARRPAGRRLLLLRRRGGRPAPGHGAADRLPGGGRPSPGCHRAARLRLPRRAARRGALPRLLRPPYRRRTAVVLGRRAGGGGGRARPLPGRAAAWGRRLSPTAKDGRTRMSDRNLSDSPGPRDEALEAKDAVELLGWALERFRPRIGLASSFGAEDVVLIDMLMELDPRARVFTLDTGRLHSETYALAQALRDRYGLAIEVYFP